MEEKNNKLALGVSFGFAGGAILGVILGVLTKNFAAGLAIGVGCGIAIGTIIGRVIEYYKKANQRIISGYIMASIGLVMLVIHAIAYLFHIDLNAPVLTIIGIVFVVISTGIVRKSRK